MENTKWTQEEMDELYLKMQQKAMTDEEFRKELLEDANKALEKLAEKPLPEGMKLKIIENDPAYTATLVLPDMVDEEIDLEDMKKAAGGINAAAIVSVCGAAVGIGPCVADICGARLRVKTNIPFIDTDKCSSHLKVEPCVGHVCGLKAKAGGV